jgi:hypothetical protein
MIGMGFGKLIRDVSSDDGAIKLLFDHVRNLGICALVFGAAMWKFRHLGKYALWQDVFDIVLMTLLTVFGCFLFVVNQLHAVKKLRAAQQPRWVMHVFYGTYSLVTVTIILAVLNWPA